MDEPNYTEQQPDLATLFQQERAARIAQEERLAALEKETPNYLRYAQPPQQEQPNHWVDPAKATQQQINQSVAPLAHMTIQNGIALAKQSLRNDRTSNTGKAYAKWPGEVEAEMERMFPKQFAFAAWASVDNWSRAAKAILADHLDEITNTRRTSTDFFTEGVTSAPGPQQEPEQKELTGEERQMAKLLHLDEKTWLARRNAGRRVA